MSDDLATRNARDSVERFDREKATTVTKAILRDLFDVPRSLTGDGNRKALEYLGEIVPGLSTVEVPSGRRLFDWVAPPEWRIRAGRLTGPDGSVIVDFAHSPLHVIGYSEAVDAVFDLDDLLPHLHSLPERPEAIPYRTSYYERTWGFCLPHRQLMSLQPGRYHAFIDAELDDNGSLSYGEARLGGNSRETIVTAHICHPAQANDNLSGVAAVAAAFQQLSSLNLRNGARALFLPGGIGSLAWLTGNESLVPEIAGGISVACVGDTASLRFKTTREGQAVVDRAVGLVAAEMGIELAQIPFDPYGFDERNFSSPGFALPFGSLTRSGHGGYPEYHSSDDSIDLVEVDRLVEAAEFVFRFVVMMASNRRLLRTEPRGEPQLGRRGLYGSIGGLRSRPEFETALLWVANFADGDHDLVDVATRSGIRFSDVVAASDALEDAAVVFDPDE